MHYRSLLVTTAILLASSSGQLTWRKIQTFVNKSKRLPYIDVCGIQNSTYQTKIVSGSPASLGSYPWMANIGYVFKNSTENQTTHWLCAGSLITKQWVVSAAHCFLIPSVTRRYRPTTVRLGDLDLDPAIDDKANPIDFEIHTIITHRYDDLRKTNDIALIKLKTEVQFTPLIGPICLSPEEFDIRDFVGFNPTVAGWGKTAYGSSTSNIITHLQETEVEIQDRRICRANITKAIPSIIIDDRVICAASPGKDACQGDSGGPLMLSRYYENAPDEGNMFLMGIVSYGIGCALGGYPGVYTRVSKFMPWIIENLDI